jgi:hypothetical protein
VLGGPDPIALDERLRAGLRRFRVHSRGNLLERGADVGVGRDLGAGGDETVGDPATLGANRHGATGVDRGESRR